MEKRKWRKQRESKRKISICMTFPFVILKQVGSRCLLHLRKNGHIYAFDPNACYFACRLKAADKLCI